MLLRALHMAVPYTDPGEPVLPGVAVLVQLHWQDCWGHTAGNPRTKILEGPRSRRGRRGDDRCPRPYLCPCPLPVA